MNAPKMTNNASVQAVYADIWNSLEELGREEVLHYMREFPYEKDFNLVQYGNMRIYYADIREMYISAGYKRISTVYKKCTRGNMAGDYKVSDGELWEMYKRDVQYVAKEFVKSAE